MDDNDKEVAHPHNYISERRVSKIPYYDEYKPTWPVWLHKPYILRGELNLLVGESEIGKGVLGRAYAVRTAMGLPMPPYDPLDPTAPEGDLPDKVILVHPEDHSTDTVWHQLDVAGYDFTSRRIFDATRIRRGTVAGNTVRTKFSLPQDIPWLRRQMERMGGVGLVIIDPLMAVATKTTAFNMQVRMGILDPLQDLCYETGVAILLVHHFTKGTTVENMRDHIGGSKGIYDTMRVINAVIRHPDNPDVKVLTCLKNSLLPEHERGEALEYIIEGNSPRAVCRFRPPMPVVTEDNVEQVTATVLAMLIDAERPVNSREMATYLRLSHGIVRSLLEEARRAGLVEKHRGAYSMKALTAATDQPIHAEVSEG
jgi:hypothetical protein